MDKYDVEILIIIICWNYKISKRVCACGDVVLNWLWSVELSAGILNVTLFQRNNVWSCVLMGKNELKRKFVDTQVCGWILFFFFLHSAFLEYGWSLRKIKKK